MKDKYTEVFSFILKSKDVREKIIKKTITKLFPKLAAYQPDKFVASYLPECMNHIMNQFKKELKSTAFVAMGEIAVIVKDDFQPFLANCIAAIKATFEMKAKNTNSVKEAIVCVSLFAKAMGAGLEPALEQGGLLDHLFACGLSETLVESLSQIGKNVPNIAKSTTFSVFTICRNSRPTLKFTFWSFGSKTILLSWNSCEIKKKI
jgi:FKBP12-rapamycin complex-associated protein